MLLSLAQWLQSLSPELGFFRVFQYLTFRAVMAALTALLIGLAAGPYVIRRLRELKIGQPVRGYGMETHLSKSGTPTMGGVLILLAITVSTLLWSDIGNRFVWIVLLVTLAFGAIGWVDDWRKVVHKDPEGMRSREKIPLAIRHWFFGCAVSGIQYFGELESAGDRIILQLGSLRLRRELATQGRLAIALLQRS